MEDNELLPLDNLITELSNVEAEADTDVKEDFPLPDIITPDDIDSGTGTELTALTPTILIAEEGGGGEMESGTKNYSVDKNYTVDEGFERPEGGWDTGLSTASVCGTEDYCDSSDSEDNESADNKSSTSSSSSFPSESSGIFYKAEYTPPPLPAQPASGLLSVENRDSYWRDFFTRSSKMSGGDGGQLEVQRSRSGCEGLSSPPGQLCQSQSDAVIGYNDPVTYSDLTSGRNISYQSDIEQVPQEDSVNERSSLHSQDKKIEGQSEDAPVIPRTLKSPLRNEIFDQPWTEVGGDSPEQVASQDNLTSTISQEMQDLLTSIQSLGKSEEPSQVKKSKQSPPSRSPVKNKEPSPTSPSQTEKNVDFESLMKEVESQIRFSVTAELLERMTNCPSIENYFISGLSDVCESQVSPDTYLGSPPIPDLLKTTVRQAQPPPPPVDRMSQTHFFSSGEERKASLPAFSCPPAAATRGLTSPSPDYRRRFTSLPRPSDMTGANNFPVTGRVPDMRARVSCSSDQDSYSTVCSDLSAVRSDIDSLCDIINTSPDLADRRDSQVSTGRFDNEKVVQDLRDTRHLMKDIEYTVDNFRRHLSLPNGKVMSDDN